MSPSGSESPRPGRVWWGAGLGALLGLIDGLSALLHGPAVLPMLHLIALGSTLKGLATGLLAGAFARRVRSLPAGVAFGLAVGSVLSWWAASTPTPDGQHHYLAIVLPGSVLGAVVGFATQRR